MVRAALDEPEAVERALTPDEPVTEIEKALEAPASLEDSFRGDLMKRLRGAPQSAKTAASPFSRAQLLTVLRGHRLPDNLLVPDVGNYLLNNDPKIRETGVPVAARDSGNSFQQEVASQSGDAIQNRQTALHGRCQIREANRSWVHQLDCFQGRCLLIPNLLVKAV